MEILDLAALSRSYGILSGSWEPWFWLVPGLLIGLLGGALPGISGPYDPRAGAAGDACTWISSPPSSS